MVKRRHERNRDSIHTETYCICDGPDCANSFKLTHWDSKRAQTDGWFLQKNGDVWCPEHVPEWVAEWRAKQNG